MFRKTQGVDIVQDVYLNDNLKISRETEGQEQASGYLVMPSFQGTENTSYEMMTVRTNSSITMGTGCVSKNTGDKVIVSKTQTGFHIGHMKRQTPGDYLIPYTCSRCLISKVFSRATVSLFIWLPLFLNSCRSLKLTRNILDDSTYNNIVKSNVFATSASPVPVSFSLPTPQPPPSILSVDSLPIPS